MISHTMGDLLGCRSPSDSTTTLAQQCALAMFSTARGVHVTCRDDSAPRVAVDEFLVIQVRALNALVTDPALDRLYHRRWAAHVEVERLGG